MKQLIFLIVSSPLLLVLACSTAKLQESLDSQAHSRGVASEGDREWTAYGGDLRGIKYSDLKNVTTKNVQNLETAWTFSTGHIQHQKDTPKLQGAHTAFEATPIMVDRTLFACDPFDEVFALDARSGDLKWKYNPDIDGVSYQFACRGVSTWKDASAAPDAMCGREIFIGTMDARLIALDSKTGKPCPGFGDNGVVQLKAGLGDILPKEYAVTSPPTVVGNLVITGAGILDNIRTDGPSGVIRAFDTRTGKLAWSWNAVPDGYVRPAGEKGDWARSTPNAWGIFTADPDSDMLFVPTGGPSLDLFGGLRNGLDFYGSSVVALQASTGKYLWHFQTVHHDLWDYDVPSQPSLFTMHKGTEDIPALAQTTKVGHVFILDRRTGKPIFPVIEKPVPQTDVKGEYTSPTQPFPTQPPPLYLDQKNIFANILANPTCFDADRGMRYDGVFTPPSLQGSVTYPGALGGTDWGGASIDPERQILVLNQSHIPLVSQLVRKDKPEYRAFLDNFDGASDYDMKGAPYAAHRPPIYDWTSKVPCAGRPIGELIAINLTDGTIRWREPLGSTAYVIPGSPNLGGSLVTAGGVTFIGATIDSKFRAFETETGKELKEWSLVTQAAATPMTYSIDGEQFVVISVGGHMLLHSQEDDKIVAFHLKR